MSIQFFHNYFKNFFHFKVVQRRLTFRHLSLAAVAYYHHVTTTKVTHYVKAVCPSTFELITCYTIVAVIKKTLFYSIFSVLLLHKN